MLNVMLDILRFLQEIYWVDNLKKHVKISKKLLVFFLYWSFVFCCCVDRTNDPLAYYMFRDTANYPAND